MRRFFFICSTVCAVLLGLDSIGGRPIAPGFDTKFRLQSDPGALAGSRLRMEADAGDLECWVRVKVSGVVDHSRPVRAEILRPGGSSLELACKVQPLEGAALEIEVISGNPTPGKEKFTWSSGRTLEVSFDEAAVPRPVLRDWAVFLAEGESDSQGKAKWRRAWLWISLVALVTALCASLYLGLQRRERSANPLELCLKAVVEKVEGGSKQETREMREVLRRVLFDGAQVNEALGRVKGRSGSRKSQVWLRARSRFQSRIADLIQDLSKLRARINSLDG